MVAHCNCHEGVGATVVEIPFPLKRHQAFDEYRACRILSALLEISLRFVEWVIKTVEHLVWVLLVEEYLACAICIGGVSLIAIQGIVLAVIEKDNAILCHNCRRPTFSQHTVKVAWTWQD